jgi:hypothetical protein
MTAGTLILLGSLLLAETPRDHRAATRPEDRPQVTRSKGPLPVMRGDKEVHCTDLAPSPSVPTGRYRIQCDDATKTCLAASTQQLRDNGVESPHELEHAQHCPSVISMGAQLGADGYRFVEAIADSEPGWARDELGRSIQVSFELNARVYLGLGYAPYWSRLEGWELSRLRAEVGLQGEFTTGGESPVRHRIRVLEGNVIVGSEQTVDGVLIHYDNSVDRVSPIRVTSLIGGGSRGELSLSVGFWAEVARWEALQRGGEDANFLTWVAMQATVDLWHSEDLASYVRLRLGAGVETDLVRHFTVVKPQAAFEGDLTLDSNGIHHLRFAAEAEKLFLAPEVSGRPLSPERLKVRAAYEVVFLAINDKPFTLLLEGRGAWRDDLPSFPPSWEWSAHAGLRFSLGVSPKNER